MLMKRIGELEHIMANLIQDNKHLEERLDSHGARLYPLENLDIPQQVSKAVDEIVTDAVDWAIQAPLRNRFRDLPEADMKEILHQRMWETNSYKIYEDHMMLYEALEKSMNHDHSEELLKDLAEACKKKKKRRDSPKTPLGSPPHRPPPPLPPAEDSLLAQTGDMAMFMDWFCKRQGITKLKPQDLEGPAFKLFKVFHPNVIHLQYQMEQCHKLLTDSVDDSIIRHNVNKPLPLGGPPGQVIIQSDFFFNKDLEYLRYGSRPALSISKIKATYYPNVVLEAVRTHMRILSFVIIKVFSMYGYDYMKKIVLCRADLKEHIIAKRDFKYLYPSDFEALYLLNLQGHLNHLPRKDTKILTTAVNLWTRHLIDEALDYRVKEFKVNRMNPGLNTRFWTRKDVDRSKEFMFAIQKQLNTRRIFRNLESFVGGRVRDGDYRLLKRTE
uniref:Uncharacterized protein n=1 Tax=Tanacetum cinerariifolium TaxID=118510 RepID=A0A699GT34_TANCI|nr:hypothetical protein [Tanacetum cinerariifolium]